jgi:CubicO group peptidase (beta-lactamase class C family)
MLDAHGRSRRSPGLAVLALASTASTACTPLWVASGYTSHVLCSATFVSGLDTGAVYQEAVRPVPGLSRIAWAMRFEVDESRQLVRTRIGGGFETTAQYRSGLGCTIAQGSRPEPPQPERGAASPVAAPAAPFARGGPVEAETDALREALDHEFLEPGSPQRGTKAVVVVSEGRIVAERYAPGYGVDTPILGWSMAKSLVNALVGVLVRQGRVSVHQPAPIATWRGAGDPRSAITIDHLLRHTSGLALEETNSGFDPSTRMLFVERDSAAFAISAPLGSAPGTRYGYSDGNYQVLSRIVRDAAGGGEGDVIGFARRELLDPLGMTTVTLELDAAGTPLGSAFVLASARDWARLGMLYLDDGVVDGRRLLPEGWVRYSSSPTLDGPYAAGFWRGTSAWRARWHVPDDLFFASGALGQRVVIVPSEHLVIARLGVTQSWPDFDPDGLGRLIADVRAALRHPGPRERNPE